MHLWILCKVVTYASQFIVVPVRIFPTKITPFMPHKTVGITFLAKGAVLNLVLHGEIILSQSHFVEHSHPDVSHIKPATHQQYASSGPCVMVLAAVK
jgi:hypothetical protein